MSLAQWKGIRQAKDVGRSKRKSCEPQRKLKLNPKRFNRSNRHKDKLQYLQKK